MARRLEVARVAADPAVVPQAAAPGGWGGLVYHQPHGSTQVCYFDHPGEYLDAVEKRLAEAVAPIPAGCIFDDTALGAATSDALAVQERLRGSGATPG